MKKDLEEEKERIACEFREAAHDVERNAEIELWDTLSVEGLDESNAY
jgi:hypothetical protein